MFIIGGTSTEDRALGNNDMGLKKLSIGGVATDKEEIDRVIVGACGSTVVGEVSTSVSAVKNVCVNTRAYGVSSIITRKEEDQFDIENRGRHKQKWKRTWQLLTIFHRAQREW